MVVPGWTITVTVFLFLKPEGESLAVSGAKKSVKSAAFDASILTGVLLIVALKEALMPPVRWVPTTRFAETIRSGSGV